MKYYVYELINSLDNKPFYIGKGSGNRMYIHAYYAKKEVSSKHQTKKMRHKIHSIWNKNGNIIYNKIFETNDTMEAYAMETKRINELGINNLCNIQITPPISEEVYNMIRKKRIGYTPSEETRRKISQTLRGHVVTELTRKKIGDACRGKKIPCSPLRKAKIAQSRKPNGGFPDVVSPDGIRYSIDILSDFCREHNLHLPAMCGLLKKYKNTKSHRGWRLY